MNVDLPKGASISISPGDFAKLRTFKQELTVKAAGATLEADTEKRDVSTAERRNLASEHNACPTGPIRSTVPETFTTLPSWRVPVTVT